MTDIDALNLKQFLHSGLYSFRKSSDHPGVREQLRRTQRLRDVEVWSFPIIPDAIGAYQDLVATHEWAVAGPLENALKAVDYYNQTEVYDLHNGAVYEGLETFLRRRVLDHLVVGRTAFGLYSTSGRAGTRINYLDPTYLHLERREVSDRSRRTPVPRRETAWNYANIERYTPDNLFLNHPKPIGTKYFVSPLESVVPYGRLGWLLNEHNTASLDGRKIRDILFVSNVDVYDGLLQAIKNVVALWAGADPTSDGIPVVEVSNPNGADIKNLFSFLGLSSIPDKFEQGDFYNLVAVLTSGAIGLSLREFWQAQGYTNRSVEHVDLQRQQQKGPNAFIRSEQRLLNHRRITSQFGVGDERPRFGFIEESDVQTEETRAKVLKMHAETLKIMRESLGDSILPEEWIAWQQSLGSLPYGLTIQEDASDSVVVATDQTLNTDPDEERVEGQDSIASLKSAPYGTVLVGREYDILDRRVKTFNGVSLVAQQRDLPDIDIDVNAIFENSFDQSKD